MLRTKPPALPARVRYTAQEQSDLPSLLKYLFGRSLAHSPDGNYIVYTGFPTPVFKGTRMHLYQTSEELEDRVGTIRCIGNCQFVDGSRSYLFAFEPGPQFSPDRPPNLEKLSHRMEWNRIRGKNEDTPDKIPIRPTTYQRSKPLKEFGKKKGRKWGHNPEKLSSILKADKPTERELEQIDDDLATEVEFRQRDTPDEYNGEVPSTPPSSPSIPPKESPVDIDAILSDFNRRNGKGNF